MFHQISGHHGLAISYLRETEAQGIWLMDGGATFPTTSRPVHPLKSTFCPFLQPRRTRTRGSEEAPVCQWTLSVPQQPRPTHMHRPFWECQPRWVHIHTGPQISETCESELSGSDLVSWGYAKRWRQTGAWSWPAAQAEGREGWAGHGGCDHA